MDSFLSSLWEFSRSHCIAICALLVPANLIATSQTLLLVWFRRPIAQIRLMAIVASLYAILLPFHVVAWWMIGIVMIPTYVLSALGGVCIAFNLVAIAIATRQTNPTKLAKPDLA